MIRVAVAADVPAVHELERELFGVDAWSEQSVLEELTGLRRTALVACDPHVVGYAVTRSAGDVVDLQRIAVHPRWRRQGLARELLAGVDTPHERMLLEVSAVNAAAIALYVREGFEEIARRPRYYRDGSDAVVMERMRP